jgi:hypothetical protein
MTEKKTHSQYLGTVIEYKNKMRRGTEGYFLNKLIQVNFNRICRTRQENSDKIKKDSKRWHKDNNASRTCCDVYFYYV